MRATKILSATPSGRIRKTTAYKPSAYARRLAILRELGIDPKAFQLQTLIDTYQRAQRLGIQLV